MHARLRKIALFAVLGGVVALVVLDPMSEKPVGSPSSPASSRPQGASGLAEGEGGAKGESRTLRLTMPEHRALSETRSELFGSRSWQPPAPKVVAAPVVPTAPPLPYRFAGKLLQDGKLQVFLAKGDAAIPIKPGEILDGTYRVESIGEDKITLIYLPLSNKQDIPVHSSLRTAAAGRTRAGVGTIPTASVIASDAGAPDGKTEGKPAQLLWVGPPQVRLGNPFSVALRVTSERPVRASPMQVKFDPNLLETVAVKPGGFFRQGDRHFSYRVNPDGTIFVGAFTPGPVPAADAEFLVLTFRPLKPAAVAELSIASLNLQGASGRTIAFNQLGAFRTAIAP